MFLVSQEKKRNSRKVSPLVPAVVSASFALLEITSSVSSRVLFAVDIRIVAIYIKRVRLCEIFSLAVIKGT